ncbi:ATP-binding protein [Leifsonia sp. Root112D2]|uniref:ATP-binding protein n=1 Tax=Leifsonia sp. Root112D2 TaxID=1736426 RepID=UPI0006F4E819|nr:DUF4143 domain-containing protein [Leifsonia sp. Root112D2]KQV06316.1 hypothetical protein ASC63_02295 [Leifsonia sp. Root112D2]
MAAINSDYRPRIIDAEIQEALSTLGGVLIEGPRASGKTATALEHGSSSVRLDTDASARALAGVEPSLLLAGDTPRVIDEWQLEPGLWNAVRQEIDNRREPGQFILTGSSVPADDVTRHTGAGRIMRLKMRPMSLYESGHSDGSVSFKALMEGEPAKSVTAGLSLSDTVERLCIGGWPGFQAMTAENAGRAMRSYLGDVVRADFPRVDSTRRDPARVQRLLGTLARNVATEVADSKLAADASIAGDSMKAETAAEYVSTLERLMLVENQGSWATHLRSRDVVRKSPKRHFVDPSLAVAALGASPAMLLKDLNTLGFLFESLVIRDLRIFAQALDGTIKHYRDASGLEVDAIVTLRDGSWAAIEIKLGDNRVDEAAASLLRFNEKVDTSKVGKPKFLAVITTTKYAYRRDDGVDVVPLGAFGP